MADGNHFILDVEGVNKEKLIDKNLMEKVLLELPEMVNMKRLTEPMVVKGADYNPGLTGVVIIETSNIVLHTFENTGKFSLDIFSVKPINQEKIVSYLKNHFNFKEIRRKTFERL